MLRTIGPVAVSVLFASVAFSAPRPPLPPNPKPTKVEIVAVPPAQPTDVNIISTPAATPTKVDILSTPPDESAHAMVRLTQWLVGANMLLCVATVWGTLKQGWDLKRRDRATMEREIRRGAQKNTSGAIWLHQMALEIPALASRVYRLSTNADLPKELGRDVESALNARQKRLSEITDISLQIVSKHVLSFEGMSDKSARTLLGTVDLNDVELESMRDAITSDRARYDMEISALLQNITAMQAAQTGRM